MICHSINHRTRYNIKLQQHFIFQEQVIRNTIACLYNGFEICVLIALPETGTMDFYPGFIDFTFGFAGIGFIGLKLLEQAFGKVSKKYVLEMPVIISIKPYFEMFFNPFLS